MQSAPAIGSRVYFGRPNGEQTLGQVVRVNVRTATVKQLEERGVVRTRAVGTIWRVPFSMLTAAGAGDVPTHTTHVHRAPPVRGVDALPTTIPACFVPTDEAVLLIAKIASCYSRLSPENLFADGERSRSAAMRLQAEINRELRELQLKLGVRLSEDEAYRLDNIRRHGNRKAV